MITDDRQIDVTFVQNNWYKIVIAHYCQTVIQSIIVELAIDQPLFQVQ